jgi:hypothetical protein
VTYKLCFLVSVFLFSCTSEQDELAGDVGDASERSEASQASQARDGEVSDELKTEGELAGDARDASERNQASQASPVCLDVEKWDMGGYPNQGPWVTVAYESEEDYGGILSASRIALLARLAVDVWRELEYPNVDAVADYVSRFHVYAISNEDTWARFVYPDLYATSPSEALDAVDDYGAWCKPAGDARYVDVPDGARFFIVIDASFLAYAWSAETVLHEITHAILYKAYGDADGNHLRGDMWLPRSGVDNGSFMALVLKRSPF